MAKENKTEDIILVTGLGLMGLGTLLFLKKRKGKVGPGDTVTGVITLRGRKGNPGNYWVGFGLAPANAIPGGAFRTIFQFHYQAVNLNLTADWKAFGPFTITGTLPEAIPDNAEKLDAFVFVQTVGGSLNPDATDFLNGWWKQDVLTISY